MGPNGGNRYLRNRNDCVERRWIFICSAQDHLRVADLFILVLAQLLQTEDDIVGQRLHLFRYNCLEPLLKQLVAV